jgi:hypothetical protein
VAWAIVAQCHKYIHIKKEEVKEYKAKLLMRVGTLVVDVSCAHVTYT